MESRDVRRIIEADRATIEAVQGDLDVAAFGVPRAADPALTRARMTDAIAYAIANNRRVVIPPGEFRISSGNTAPATYLGSIQVPSNAHIVGAGGVLKFVGVDGEDENDSGTNWPWHCMFWVEPGASDVTFEGLDIRGENDPYEDVLNHQSAAIYMQGMPHGGAVNPNSDVSVLNCRFSNLWGFPVHSLVAKRVVVDGCVFTDCANGVNTLGSESRVSNCQFYGGEGIELAGPTAAIGGNYHVIGNTFVGMGIAGAIALGGSADLHYRAVVANNLIDGSGSQGIILTDGLHDVLISGNVIRGTASHAIQVHTTVDPGFNGPPQHVTISGNVVSDCSQNGIYIADGVSNVLIAGNRVDRVTTYGLAIRNATSIRIGAGNHFSGTAGGVSIDTSDVTMAEDNYYSTIATLGADTLCGRHVVPNGFGTTALPASLFARRVIVVSGTPAAGAHTLLMPAASGQTRVIRNLLAGGGALDVKVFGAATATIANGATKSVFCDGVDWIVV
jgi:parallel beta-helix repeat protein